MKTFYYDDHVRLHQYSVQEKYDRNTDYDEQFRKIDIDEKIMSKTEVVLTSRATYCEDEIISRRIWYV